MSELRKDLPDGMPESVGRLPVDHRGYPVPWFVAWIDGKPEFRCADGEKWFAQFRKTAAGSAAKSYQERSHS
jgi:hypothetical protein